ARSSRYEHLRQHRDPWVTAVFPVQALTAVPEQVRRAQSAHLAALVGAGRVSIHLVPEGTVLVGITSPILMVRLADGGRAGSSDHISGNVLLDDQVDWARLDELSKRAFGLALPADQSLTLLGDLAKCASGTRAVTATPGVSASRCGRIPRLLTSGTRRTGTRGTCRSRRRSGRRFFAGCVPASCSPAREGPGDLCG